MRPTARPLWRIFVGLASALVAVAWTPYGEGPPATPETQNGIPPGFGYGTPPPWYRGRPGLGGTVPGQATDVRTPRFEQTITDEGYVLTISTGSLQPEQIGIQAHGPWLVVTIDNAQQRVEEQTYGGGQGYARSYSFSSGRSNRRFPVPRDADLGAMTREDGDGEVRVLIPRRTPPTR